MDTLKLGQIISPERIVNQGAAHVAVVVASVKAGGVLSAGMEVGVDDKGIARASNTSIGIVDPFLKTFVKRGEKFWLFLFPSACPILAPCSPPAPRISLTSWYHDWEHQAFLNDAVPKVDDRVEAIKALEIFADILEVSYKELIAGAERYINTGEIMRIDNNSEDIPVDFWKHFKTITGRSRKKHQDVSFFYCCY